MRAYACVEFENGGGQTSSCVHIVIKRIKIMKLGAARKSRISGREVGVFFHWTCDSVDDRNGDAKVKEHHNGVAGKSIEKGKTSRRQSRKFNNTKRPELTKKLTFLNWITESRVTAFNHLGSNEYTMMK